MRPSLVIAILVALPAASPAAVDLRLTPELVAGGGWGTAIYIGDPEGAGWQSHLGPGLTVDLSTGPVVKIRAAWHSTLSHYPGERRSLSHDGALGVRVRLGKAIDLELRGSVDSAAFEGAAGILEGHATTPPAVSSTGLEAGPLVRWRISPHTTTEASIDAGVRTSRLDDGGTSRVREDHQVAALGIRHRFSPALEAALRYRHLRNRSDEAVWRYDGDGGQLSLGWAPLGELLLRGWAGIQWNRFDDRSDRYAYAGLGASLPVAPATTAEIAWSFGENEVTESAAAVDWSGIAGSRHLLWSGLRVELPWWL